MRAFVFTDGSLARQAGQFVWLALDVEKAVNAPFRERFPVQALPTYFVVDPADEKVALRWVGGATVPQLHRILDDGRLAVAAKASGGPLAGGADTAASEAADGSLARADRLYGEGNEAEAVQAYEEALSLAPADWPPYGRAVESLLFALYRTEQWERAARLAREAYSRLRRTPSAANLAVIGLDCALRLDPKDPARGELVAAMETCAREVVDDLALPVAADDRSGVFIALHDAREDAGDQAGAKEVAAEWSAFLDAEAAKAATPEQRMVFDSHRLSAYLALEQPERAIPMLEASERDAPEDYNPPARLAVAYRALERWDDALAATDRALARVYGPRKLRVLEEQARIHQDRGDVAAARRSVEEAIRVADSLPPGQRSESRIASLKQKLATLE